MTFKVVVTASVLFLQLCETSSNFTNETNTFPPHPTENNELLKFIPLFALAAVCGIYGLGKGGHKLYIKASNYWKSDTSKKEENSTTLKKNTTTESVIFYP